MGVLPISRGNQIALIASTVSSRWCYAPVSLGTVLGASTLIWPTVLFASSTETKIGRRGGHRGAVFHLMPGVRGYARGSKPDR